MSKLCRVRGSPLAAFLGYNMSVAVWVGLIALAGLDAETGVVMLLFHVLLSSFWSNHLYIQKLRRVHPG